MTEQLLSQNDHDLLVEIRTIIVDVRERVAAFEIASRLIETRVKTIEDANGAELLAWVRDFRSKLGAYVAIGLGASTFVGWLVTLAVHYISK